MALSVLSRLLFVLVAGVTLGACELAGDIFQAGMARAGLGVGILPESMVGSIRLHQLSIRGGALTRRISVMRIRHANTARKRSGRSRIFPTSA